MSFKKLNLHSKILKAVSVAGYLEPTAIQFKAIPKIMQGLDIRASAQTGTGKTAAFLLPALDRLTHPTAKEGKGPRILILAPTRELAMQISAEAAKYSKFLQKVNTVCICGGVSYHKQLRNLSRHVEILIATPGRLIDLVNRRKVNFSRLEMLILDEADRMLDMGFIDPVKEIVAATPTTRQTLLFSATLSDEIIKLSQELLNKPMEIIVHSKKEKHENIKQTLHYVDNLKHKNRLLDHILRGDAVHHAIVFTSTKRHAEQLVEELKEKKFKAGALHGDMNQRQRTRTIDQFKKGKFDILVATDVAARGVDVPTITHVINFDLPRNVEDYVHRIGRTGRAGAKGSALSFACGRDTQLLKKIEGFTGHPITVEEIPGFEPSMKIKSAPPKQRPASRRFRKNDKPRRRSPGKKARFR